MQAEHATAHAMLTRKRLIPMGYLLTLLGTLEVVADSFAQGQTPALAQNTVQADETSSANAAQELPAIVVPAASDWSEPTERTGAYTVRRSDSATGLTQTLRETPQSVSVITRPIMDDFNLNSVNDVLDAVAGVVVEKVETDRTYYTARGFDIVNFQVDGIGIPLVYGLVDGDLDTAIYDRVDVMHGAAGLLNGTGNPSATINFVRKRPTRDFQASAGLTLGSWSDVRVDADVSGALNASGSVRARLVLAGQDRESYLDRYQSKKGVFYGVVEADLSDNTLLTFGHTQQNNRPKGVLWGALPLYYSDGSPTNYDVSTSTSPDWTQWDSNIGITFAELRHDFANGWHATTVFTHRDVSSRSKLFYVYGTPDAETGEGLFVWPSRHSQDNDQNIVDVRASGPFTLMGREHEAIIGFSTSRSTLNNQSIRGRSLGEPLPDLSTWDGIFSEPIFDVPGGGGHFVDKQHSVYAATRLQASNRLKFILGANSTWLDSEGDSYGAGRDKSEHKTTPYIGAIYDLTSDISLYGSHTAIFLPQSEIGADLNRLKPAEGYNNELGVKAEWLDKRLNASFALFQARQNNLAQSTYFDENLGITIYEGVDTRSQGFEFELAGEIASGVKINAGYTQLSIEDTDGNDTRTFSPRRMLRLASTWQVLPQVKLGAKLNWRSETRRDLGNGITIHQPSYALLDLMARYDFDKQWSATLNLNNVTDEKYLTSLYWDQAFYGAPRNVSISVNWAY